MPSGRCRPSAFGIYTRLTGRASRWPGSGPPGQPAWPCPGGQRDLPVHARGPAPSIALCHLPHADQRVRPAPQHQFLQGPDLAQSPACAALKILCLSRRTLSSGTASQRRPSPGQRPPVRSLRGPPSPARTRVPSSCLTCPSVPAAMTVRLQRLTWSTSAPFRVRAPSPVSGQLSGTAARRSSHQVPVSRCLSAPPAFASWTILFPPGTSASLTVGLPATLIAAGPRRGSHVPLARDTTGEGALSAPGAAVSTRPVKCPRPPPAASQRPAPAPRPQQPISRRLTLTRRHQGFTHLHPSGLPLTCGPRMEQGPLGLNPELRTLRSPAAHVRARTGLEH